MGIYTGNDLSAVPMSPGVYALISLVPRAAKKGKENVIYVGQTGGRSKDNGLKKRLKQHLVEETGTVIGDKWPLNIDKSQIDKVVWWETEHLNIGRSPTESTKIFEEYVKRELKPMFRDRGKFPVDDEGFLTKSELKVLFSTGRKELLLPSYANLVDRIQKLESTVEEMSRVISNLNQRG